MYSCIYNEASDVWAVGMTLWELFFDGKLTNEVTVIVMKKMISILDMQLAIQDLKVSLLILFYQHVQSTDSYMTAIYSKLYVSGFYTISKNK